MADEISTSIIWAEARTGTQRESADASIVMPRTLSGRSKSHWLVATRALLVYLSNTVPCNRAFVFVASHCRLTEMWFEIHFSSPSVWGIFRFERWFDRASSSNCREPCCHTQHKIPGRGDA